MPCPRCGTMALIHEYGHVSCLACGFKSGPEPSEPEPDIISTLYHQTTILIRGNSGSLRPPYLPPV